MRRPMWWSRLGGENALSRWSWLIGMPSGIALAVSSAGPVPHWVPWLAAVVGANIAAGAVLAVAYLTVLAPGARPSRPLVAVTTFAVAGATRAALLTLAYPLTGTTDPMSAPERILGNVVLAIILLGLIALAVDSSRRHSRLMAELLVAQRTLDALSQAKEEELRRIDGEVERCLDVTVADVAEGRRSAGSGVWLRQCAEAVRRVSHELDRDAFTALPLPTVPDPRLWDRVTPLLRRMGPPRPVICALVVEVAPITGVASQCGWPVALFNAFVGGTVLAGLAMAVSRWYRRPTSGVWNLALLAAVYAAVALVAMLVTRSLGLAVQVDVPIFTLGVPYIVGVALGLSLVTAVKEGYAADLRHREEAVAAAAQRADTNSAEVRERRRTLAALLHGPVQGELLRAAAENADTDQVTERVRSLLLGLQGTVPAHQEVTEVVAAWSSALRLTVDAPEGIWPVLDERPATRQAVIDVISEGLGNAVRHGSGTEVRLHLGLTGSEITVEVSSPGTYDPAMPAGLGSAILGRRCSSWRIEADGPTVRLLARVTIVPGTGATGHDREPSDPAAVTQPF